MAWRRLTVEDLQQVLAYDEFTKLDEMSLSVDINNICLTILDSTSDLFRGAWTAKGYDIDVRDHYVSEYYRLPILNYARYLIWSRFPNSEGIGLDDPREKEYDEACELLKNPYLGTEKPDYSGDPELSGKTNASGDASLTIPFLRIPPKPFAYGFNKMYWTDLGKKQ